MADETGDIEARLERAIQHKIQGEYDDAVTLLSGVLAESPNHARTHHQLGLVYGFTGLFDESVEEMETAARLDPDSILILNDLGKTHTMLGDYEKAIPVFERVLERDPLNEEAIKNLKFLR